MIILPAIDLYERKAVRLLKGDYSKMTVYSDDPPKLAQEFREAGAEWLHMVDLEGARCGGVEGDDQMPLLRDQIRLCTPSSPSAKRVLVGAD